MPPKDQVAKNKEVLNFGQIAEWPKVHYDEVDVEACLKRKTDDGPGEREPDPPNWTSFATEGVEVDDS